MAKDELRKLITVFTFKGSDKFYFKNPPKVGTVNGKDAYCVFYYSHHDEYFVFAIAWEGTGFDFHYLNEHEMTPTHDFHFQTLNESGKFVPAVHVVDMLPSYWELILASTQEQENIDYNEKYTKLYDRQRELQYKFQRLRDGENGYNRYDEKTYIEEFPQRLELNEYDLLHDRYVNLKPKVKKEEELEAKKLYTKEEILKDMVHEKEMNDRMMEILNSL